MLFLLVVILGGGLYVAYTLNLLGPMTQMANAAATQGLEIGKAKLREFIENNDTARQALSMPPRRAPTTDSDAISLDTLDGRGRRKLAVSVTAGARKGGDEYEDEI